MSGDFKQLIEKLNIEKDDAVYYIIEELFSIKEELQEVKKNTIKDKEAIKNIFTESVVENIQKRIEVTFENLKVEIQQEPIDYKALYEFSNKVISENLTNAVKSEFKKIFKEEKLRTKEEIFKKNDNQKKTIEIEEKENDNFTPSSDSKNTNEEKNKDKKGNFFNKFIGK